MQNLREKESSLLGRMLTLSNPGGAGNMDFNDQWKVLIYDQDCRDIISPLLNIGALRQRGVTLHMLINTNREAVPDAPAVYFVRPTEANLKRIAEDCAKQLYRTVYLNFLTRLDRNLMEKFAQDLVTSNSVAMVSKIYDQYLDMIAIEPNLFTLNIKDSFMQYNEPSLSEAQIRGFMHRVATGLLSTVRVMGALPIIRCAPGGAAEMLARELNTMLRENISSRGSAQSLFEDCLVNDRSRPLLLIADRVTDLFPILQHAATYQALINDLLDMKLNRVTIDLKDSKLAAGGSGSSSSGSPPPSKKKTYDLNTQNDGFLRTYAGSPFPEAVDANEKELAEVSQREAALRSRPSAGGGDADAAALAAASSAMQHSLDAMGASMEGKGRDLSEAIESLPEILQKKANLEAHTNVLQAVMKKIASREVPTYFEMEQDILSSGGIVSDRGAVSALLKDASKGLLEDKLRLLMLLAVTGDSNLTSKASMEELDNAFTQGCQGIAAPNTPSESQVQEALKAVQFLRRLQSLQSGGGGMRKGGMGMGMGSSGGNSSSNALFSSFLSSAQSRASSLMAKAASFFTKFTPYEVTRTALNLAEGRSCPEDDMYLCLDPRSRDDGNHRNSSSSQFGAGSGHKYSDVIVFSLGGGSYSEFYNLQEPLKDKANSGISVRSIAYGCTEMLSGDAFVDQLKRLANPTATGTATTTAVASTTG